MLRRGVSVIEVLFAMGVVAIGLLGVMSVVPVALHSIGQGSIFDQASRAGQNALREFNTRGMARADQWIRFHPQGRGTANARWARVTWERGFDGFWGLNADEDSLSALFDPYTGTEGQGWAANNANEAGWFGPNGEHLDLLTDYPVRGVSFCLDPRLLVARDPGTGAPNFSVNSTMINGSSIDVDANQFPYRIVLLPQSSAEPPLLKMQRISLRASFRTGPVTPNEGPLRKPHADRIFVLDDELVFEIPDEVENPPQIRYLEGIDPVSGQVGPVLREHEGLYSWMATLVPERDQATSQMPERDPTTRLLTSQVSDRYRLSIVVFHRRDPLMEMNTSNERVAYIPWNEFLAGGIGGGDVRLYSYVESPAIPDPEQELEVGEGDWVLLSALLRRAVATPAGTTFEDLPYFRWYRVASADETTFDSDAGTWVRNVTLDGPNWPHESIRPHPTLMRDNTRVTLVKNVVAVFEKTITIETSSDRNLR